MPKLEAALYGYLSTDPRLSALVGDRIYPFRLPEPTKAQPISLPAVSWQRISAQRTYTYDSFEDTAAFVKARVQFSCWSNSPLEAIQVGEAVLLALSGYNGDMAGELIGSAEAALEIDDYEAGTKLYRRVIDFLISYEDEESGS